MGEISATYASPGLRHGLLLEDHPAVSVDFDVQRGSELGIPDRLGGDKDYCVATISFPSESDRKPVVGWKPLPKDEKLNRGQEHVSDIWLVLCSKALGRALKRAGYPDDLKDLKSLVLWRQREAEIAAITAGTARVQLAPAAIEKALEAGAVSNPEHTGADDGEAPNTETVDDEVVDAEIVPPPGVNPETGEIERNDEQEMIAELILGLDEKENKSFAAFCKSLKIDAATAARQPELLNASQCQELLGWLEQGAEA